MESNQPNAVVVGRAQIPPGDSLIADILAVDDMSYFYLSFKDSSVMKSYNEMLEKMRGKVLGNPCISSAWTNKTGLLCIVEYSARRGGTYVRGTLQNRIPGTKLIRVALLDDVLDVDVHRSQIYHTDFSILEYPTFALRCKLAGMEMFQAHPYLKKVYTEYMRSQWKPNSTVFIAKLVDRQSPVPTVQLTTLLGKDLTELLQEYIPTTLRLEYPMTGVSTKVKLTCCTTQGHVWFQYWEDKRGSLLELIKSRLRMFYYGNLEKPSVEWSVNPSWTDRFYQGSGEVFIYRKLDNEKCYRVRPFHKTMDGMVAVMFLDYGDIAMVAANLMVPAREVDPNLCLIPPQCLPLTFVGAECHKEDDRDIGFDVETFWKYVGCKPVNIIIRVDSSDHVNLLDKTKVIPVSFLDPHLSFVPPQCVPVRFSSDKHAKVGVQRDIEEYWTNGRNQPVSKVLHKYKVQFGSNDKFSDGVIPPEVDIRIRKQIRESSSMSYQTEQSLFDIYHMNNCLAHLKPVLKAPAVSVEDVGNQNEEEKSGQETKSEPSPDKDKTESQEDSGVSAGSPEVSVAPNWVQWSVIEFGLGDSDSDLISSDCSSQPKTPPEEQDVEEKWKTSIKNGKRTAFH